MGNTNIDKLELEEKLSEIEISVEKLRFILSELEVYDYDYEITPYKAIEYGRHECKDADYELSFNFCTAHKRIMNIYNISLDYLKDIENKLEKLQNANM